jgi:hypothetical protein
MKWTALLVGLLWLVGGIPVSAADEICAQIQSRTDRSGEDLPVTPALEIAFSNLVE